VLCPGSPDETGRDLSYLERLWLPLILRSRGGAACFSLIVRYRDFSGPAIRRITSWTRLERLNSCGVPQATEEPYFVDERLNRSDIRSDPATGVFKAVYLSRWRWPARP
jgi:hypothetical protein